MTPNYRHSIHFFKALDKQGRPDLAAFNAAKDGRWRLAMFYVRRAYRDVTPRQAWGMVYRIWRMKD